LEVVVVEFQDPWLERTAEEVVVVAVVEEEVAVVVVVEGSIYNFKNQ
jgi:hypothetical protein